MKSIVMMGPNDPVPMQPRWPGTNLPAAQPLPPGATVDTLVENTTRWSPAQAIETIGMIAEAEKQLGAAGIVKPSGINFEQLAGSISAGAGVGTLFGPGIGTAIGAIVGLLTYAWTWVSSRPGAADLTYPNAPQSVRMWATMWAEQEYIDWSVANGRNTWGTEKEMAQGQLLFWLERWKVVITTGGTSRFYSGKFDAMYVAFAGGDAEVAALYKPMMVDYYATKEARIAAGVQNDRPYDITMMYKSTLLLPGQVDTDGDGVADNTGGGSALVAIGLAAGAALLLAKNNT